MFKTVIFDLDGTLLNTLEDLADCANTLCREKGWKTHSLDEYRYFVGYGMPKFVEKFIPEDKRTAHVLQSTLKEYTELYNLHKEDKTYVYPKIPELFSLMRNKGIKIGVLTNKDHEPSQKVVEHYLPNMADEIRGRIDKIPPKPDPAGLFALMKSLDSTARSTLFVGDSDIDVKTAKNGQLAVCGVLWGYRNKEELINAGADFTASNTEELFEIIMNGNCLLSKKNG